MPNRVIKLIMEDGSSFDYKQKTFEQLMTRVNSKARAEVLFNVQHENWEKEAISYFNLDIENFAKNKYDLIDSDEKKGIDDFDDDDILSEAEYRGILPAGAALQNENIINEDFIERFVNIVNRGNSQDIESALQGLELKFKI